MARWSLDSDFRIEVFDAAGGSKRSLAAAALARGLSRGPSLPAKILPAKIRRLDTSGDFPMDMRVPSLEIKMLLEVKLFEIQNLSTEIGHPRVLPAISVGGRRGRAACRSRRQKQGDGRGIFVFLSFMLVFICTFCSVFSASDPAAPAALLLEEVHLSYTYYTYIHTYIYTYTYRVNK